MLIRNCPIRFRASSTNIFTKRSLSIKPNTTIPAFHSIRNRSNSTINSIVKSQQQSRFIHTPPAAATATTTNNNNSNSSNNNNNNNNSNNTDSNNNTNNTTSNKSLFYTSGILATLLTTGLIIHNQHQYSLTNNINALVEATATNTSINTILPNNLPAWIYTLANDSQYEYRDLKAAFNTKNHLIFDALLGENAIKSFYYFTEKQQQQHNDNNTVAAAAEPQYREVRAIFELGSTMTGHRNIIHGGLTAALMDEISGATTFLTITEPAFTANLSINYCQPIPANSWIIVRAKVNKIINRKIYCNISVENGYGTIYARGTALYIKPKSSLIYTEPGVLVAAMQ